MASSIYTPLKGDGREFRLVVIEPSVDRRAPIRCQLNRESLHDDNIMYTALSYTWGDPQATTPILVNGIETHVTLNLEAALRYIRKPSCAVVLWADALCINQGDVDEKNHQVDMMREIYSEAELVIAWLGSASEDSDLGMKMLGMGFQEWIDGLGNRHESNEEEGPASPSSSCVNAVQETHLQLAARETSAILKLLKRSWWSRIWVVQEVKLAKRIVFKCGDAEVSGDKVSSWRTRFSILQDLCDDCDSTGDYSHTMMLLCDLYDPTNEKKDIMDCLFSYAMREATRPHDHIYGISGIIPAEDRMLLGTPDYGCRVEDLFINVATKLMDYYNSLQLLLAAGLPTLLLSSSTKMDLPSWVPDWTRPWSVPNKPIGHESENWTEDFLEPVFQISQDLKELTLEAYEFATIESVKSVPPLAQGRMPLWQTSLMTEERTGGMREPPLQRQIIALFWRGIHVDSLEDEYIFKMIASFFQELEEYRISLHRHVDSDYQDESDYLAGFLDWIGEARDGRADDEILTKVFSVKDAQRFVGWYRAQSIGALKYFYAVYSGFRRGSFGTAGCSMFRTCKGDFGFTPAAARAGDILCCVPSCWAPLMFRKVQSFKYLLVGAVLQMGRDNDLLASQIVAKSLTIV